MSRRKRQREAAMEAKWADSYTGPEDDAREPDPMDDDYGPQQDGEAEGAQHEQR